MATASLGMAQNQEPTGLFKSALNKRVFWITKWIDSFPPASSNYSNFSSLIHFTILTLHGCLLWLEVISNRRVVSKLVFCCYIILGFSSIQILSAAIVSCVLNIKQSMPPKRAYGTLHNSPCYQTWNVSKFILHGSLWPSRSQPCCN